MKDFLRLCAALTLSTAFLFGCGGNDGKKLRVGAKNYTEQYVLGEILSIVLEKNGYQVERKFNLSSSAVRTAIEQGQIDLYPDFTGTAWSTWLAHTEKPPGAEQLYQLVKKEDKERHDIEWIGMFPYNNTYALAVTAETAQKYQLANLDDLARLINSGEKIKIGVDHEFFERPDGFFAMAKAYGMDADRKNVIAMETGLTYLAVDKGEVDVAMVYSTDGRLKKYDLVVLDDTRQFFPPYNAAILARAEVIEKDPKLVDLFQPLYSLLPEEVVIDLNYQVDALGKEANEVAKAFLEQAGL